MRSATLGGSVAALPTPFRDGAVDGAALERLCARQLAGGTRGLVACGSTGEAASLLPHEFERVIRIAVGVAAGRVPVIAGCHAPATEQAAALAVLAARAGVAGLLCAPPAYVKPTQEGIAAHVRVVAHAADLPVMLYDVPGRAGVAVADATVARLFERGLIWAIKDATADLARPPRLRALCGQGLAQFSGDDATAAAHRAMGGQGCVSVTANVVPALSACLHEAWSRHAMALFERTRETLAPLTEALFAESNPIPLKAALERFCLCGAQLRLPLTPPTGPTRERIAAALAGIMPREDELTRRGRLALVG